jgi:LPS-assembly protein
MGDGAGLALCGLLAVLAQPLAAGWDCRAAPDGGWTCSEAGDAVQTQTPIPAPPAGAAQAPAGEPSTASTQAAAPPAATAEPPTAPAPQPDSNVAAPLPAQPATRQPGATEPEPAPTPVVEPPPPAAPLGAPAADSAPVATADVTEPAPGLSADARDLDAGVDWAACGPIRTVPAFPDWEEGGAKPQIVEVEADSAELDQAANTVRLGGDVHVVYGVQTLDADEVEYNRDSDTVTAQGRVLLVRPEARVAGERAAATLGDGRARVEQAEYRVPAAHARGSASVAEFQGDNQSRYTDISYTTCRPGNNDWELAADELLLDHDEGLGTAHAAKLRVLGVPVVYLPTFTFPIDDRRRSGVLIPTVGSTTNTGFDVRVPYYLNLAPNYDATLTPRLMSKRGLGLGGEFRYLTPHHQGQLAGEVLPNDREFEDGQARGTLSLRNYSHWGPRLRGDVVFNYASDSQYFEDLGESLAVTSARQLERTAQLRYVGDSWDVLGRVQHYQTLDQAISPENRPYSLYPQLRYTLHQPEGFAGLSYQALAEYTYFYKDDYVRGQRVDLYPALSLPLRRPWGYVEPRLGARYTAYGLQDQELAGLSDASPDRLLGIASLDGGLYFDRRTELFGQNVRQTLEPRLFYLYVPREDQDDLPVFDTTPLDFSFDGLFRDNRYNGPDRLGDANQLTLALTSRTLEDRSGEEVLRASIGQILYFSDRSVTLPGEPAASDSTSSLVTEVSARVTREWYLRAGLQWDPDDEAGDITQALAQVSYQDRNQRLFNASYRLRKGVIDQTDLAALWPVSESTSLIARWYYSLLDDQTLEALAGIQYGRCCWRVRALVRQFADSADSNNLAFMLQLELHGLGRLGDDIDEYLQRGIYGYR